MIGHSAGDPSAVLWISFEYELRVTGSNTTWIPVAQRVTSGLAVVDAPAIAQRRRIEVIDEDLDASLANVPSAALAERARISPANRRTQT